MTSIHRNRDLLDAMFRAAVAAVDPARCLPPLLPPPPRGRTVVIAAGKAAASMAHAFEEHWQGEWARTRGFAVTRYGHGLPCRHIEVLEAAHPVPDAVGVDAARRALALVEGLGEDDLVILLLSGGGSSLLSLPQDGISLAEKQGVTRALLKSGATIGELNCVRKHLSAIKGGRLALAAWPARVLTLAISDVPGDDVSTIASGPTVPDPTTCDDALDILDRYSVEAPLLVRERLLRGTCETPKPSDARFVNSVAHIIANGMTALNAAAATARAGGLTPLILGDAIEGEAREVARVIGGMAISCARGGVPLTSPCVLLSGGEATVTVRGGGGGGPNSEFLLALAVFLAGAPDAQRRIHAMACDTDGIDGTAENAGARIAPDTLVRAATAGLNARALLDDNDALRFFTALDDLVVTGPTRTNVNDFRAVLIDRRG